MLHRVHPHITEEQPETCYLLPVTCLVCVAVKDLLQVLKYVRAIYIAYCVLFNDLLVGSIVPDNMSLNDL